MSEARIDLLPGSHGDTYEVSDGQNTVHISSAIVRRFVLDQVASLAPAFVDLSNGDRLTAYVRRDTSRTVASDDGLDFDLGNSPCKLSADAALKLSQVLIAYAALQNPHPNWLVRRESGQG
jgi:hypothetical protein